MRTTPRPPTVRTVDLDLVERPRRPTPPSTVVAAYGDYRRAIAAVERLRQQQVHRGLHLAVTDFESARVRPDATIGGEVRRGLLPALLGAGAAVVSVQAVAGASAGIVGTAAVVAAFGGLLVASAVRVLRPGNGAGRTSALVPTRFEVRTDPEVGGAAEHELATWWAGTMDGPPSTPDGRRIGVARPS